MRVNLHTHTPRCGHATGSEEEYILSAIRNGFDILGFSDHTPFPLVHGLPVGGRMTQEEFHRYLAVLQELKEKYADKIQILVALECEPLDWVMPLLYEFRPFVDYMILGNHGDPCFPKYRGFPALTSLREFTTYIADSVYGMESGLFLYMAHPDLGLSGVERMTPEIRHLFRELCRASKALHVPLEYNISGFVKHFPPNVLGYPAREFWELAAEEGVSCVVGVDAHSPSRLEETEIFDRSKVLLREIGLTVIDNPAELIDKTYREKADFLTNKNPRLIISQEAHNMQYQKGQMMAKTYTCDGKRALFDALNEQVCFRDVAPDVVFIGDSITEMFDPAVWFSDCGFLINRGISGDVAEGVRFRFDWDVLQLHPKTCVAMVGVNNVWALDIAAGELISQCGNYESLRERIPKLVQEELLPCYEEMVEKCEKAGIHLIFCSVTPVSHDLRVGFDYRNQFIDLLNDGIREITRQHAVAYCDFTPIFKNDLGQCRRDLTLDCLHPNCLGYAKMAETLRPFLK